MHDHFNVCWRIDLAPKGRIRLQPIDPKQLRRSLELLLFDRGDDVLVLRHCLASVNRLVRRPEFESRDLCAELVQKADKLQILAVGGQLAMERVVCLDRRAQVVLFERALELAIELPQRSHVGSTEARYGELASEKLERGDYGIELEQLSNRLIGNAIAAIGEPLEKAFGREPGERVSDRCPADFQRRAYLVFAYELAGFEVASEHPLPKALENLVAECTRRHGGPRWLRSG